MLAGRQAEGETEVSPSLLRNVFCSGQEASKAADTKLRYLLIQGTACFAWIGRTHWQCGLTRWEQLEGCLLDLKERCGEINGILATSWWKLHSGMENLAFSFVQKRGCGTTAELLLCTGDQKLQFAWLYPQGNYGHWCAFSDKKNRGLWEIAVVVKPVRRKQSSVKDLHNNFSSYLWDMAWKDNLWC